MSKGDEGMVARWVEWGCFFSGKSWEGVMGSRYTVEYIFAPPPWQEEALSDCLLMVR